MTDWTVERWIDDAAIAGVDYSDYWNDEAQEQDKEFNVLGGDFARMERYLAQTGLPEDIALCAAAVQRITGRGLGGVGIELAAGNLWAVPHMLAAGPIEKLYCLEYSRHRLLKIGPAVLEHYGVSTDRVVLVLGSFYVLHLEDGSLDLAFMSASFHHADDPARLLAEIRRVLKPDGVVVLIGEHVVGTAGVYVKHVAKAILSRAPGGAQRAVLGRTVDVRPLVPRPEDLVVVDPLLGDHFYTSHDYDSMFSAAGFEATRIRRPRSKVQSFVLKKR